MENNRKFWREFLELYRKLPALWNVKTKDYKNRSLKAASYEKLVNKMREVQPNADRLAVVKKINNFRTNYRRYIRNAENKKAGNRDAVVRCLWYFDMLAFLDNREPTSHNSSVAEGSEYQDEDHDDDDYGDMESISYDMKYVPSPSTSPPPPPEPKIIKKKVMKNERKLENVECIQLQSVEDEKLMKLPREHIRPSKDDDRLAKASVENFNSNADIVARSWALQYEEMDCTQKMIARKIISDVLFYGGMGQLEVTHTLEIQQLLAMPIVTLNSSIN